MRTNEQINVVTGRVVGERRYGTGNLCLVVHGAYFSIVFPVVVATDCQWLNDRARWTLTGRLGASEFTRQVPRFVVASSTPSITIKFV